ncbi:unnamed protein product [Meganyctiphanes norvegica]|uniref:Uncharacterized protein n=1 Tax=Meganyctiphanes norvegica TaxID=48144 RepID=A0AAV2QWV6_MEGNR
MTFAERKREKAHSTGRRSNSNKGRQQRAAAAREAARLKRLARNTQELLPPTNLQDDPAPETSFIPPQAPVSPPSTLPHFHVISPAISPPILSLPSSPASTQVERSPPILSPQGLYVSSSRPWPSRRGIHPPYSPRRSRRTNELVKKKEECKDRKIESQKQLQNDPDSGEGSATSSSEVTAHRPPIFSTKMSQYTSAQVTWPAPQTQTIRLQNKDSSKIVVCEDCGKVWTIEALNIDVNLGIHLQKQENIENGTMHMTSMLADDGLTRLSCVMVGSMDKETRYTWRVNHKGQGSPAESGCQILPVLEDLQTKFILGPSNAEFDIKIKDECIEDASEKNIFIEDYLTEEKIYIKEESLEEELMLT